MFLVCYQLLEPVGVEADHDLIADDDRGRGAALILLHHLAHGAKVTTHVAQLELNASLREEGFRPIAGWSTGLAEQQDAFCGHHTSLPDCISGGCLCWVRDGSIP